VLASFKFHPKKKPKEIFQSQFKPGLIRLILKPFLLEMLDGMAAESLFSSSF